VCDIELTDQRIVSLSEINYKHKLQSLQKHTNKNQDNVRVRVKL